MEIAYADASLAKICTNERHMQRELGAQVAKALKLRITEIRRLDRMEDLLLGAGRWEELHSDRLGQWSARLTANWRLVVDPEGDGPVTVVVIEIVDYHKH